MYVTAAAETQHRQQRKYGARKTHVPDIAGNEERRNLSRLTDQTGMGVTPRPQKGGAINREPPPQRGYGMRSVRPTTRLLSSPRMSRLATRISAQRAGVP